MKQINVRQKSEGKQSNYISVLANLGDLHGGNVLLDLISSVREDCDGRFHSDPKQSDSVKDDWRYKLGEIEALDRLLEVPGTAKTILNKLEG